MSIGNGLFGSGFAKSMHLMSIFTRGGRRIAEVGESLSELREEMNVSAVPLINKLPADRAR